MAENKTRPSGASVRSYLAAIDDDDRRADARKLSTLMKKATGMAPAMWGPSIVGYGSYHYRYDSGREGDFLLTGFSARRQALTVYIMPGFERFAGLLAKLGKYKTGKSCLYIRRMADIDESVLEDLVRQSVDAMRATYETNP